MKNELTKPVHRWLKQLSIPVTQKFVDEKLLSHPDYPSLASITSLLDELGVDNGAYVVNIEKLNMLPFPILIHTVDKGGRFLVVQNCDELQNQKASWLKSWDGIALLATKPTKWQNEALTKSVAEERGTRNFIIFLLAVTVISLTIWLGQFNSVLTVGLCISSAVGLGLAILIVQKELGIENEFTEKLCNLHNESDCDDVILSKKGSIGKLLTWADIGIIYFACYMLLTIFDNPLVKLLSGASISFILFSIFYQWRVAKKWCNLCLLVVAILTIQLAMIIPSISNFSLSQFNSYDVAGVTFFFSVTCLLWKGLLKPAIRNNLKSDEERFRLARFRNKPEVFAAVLKQQKTVEIRPWADDLQLGNPDSPFQIVVACNPYCAPCAKTHMILHNLVLKRDIGLTVRFAYKTPKDGASRHVIAVKQILESLQFASNSQKLHALHYWFENMNLDSFREKFPGSATLHAEQAIQRHRDWATKSEIKFTPSIFINSYALSKDYEADLLIHFMDLESAEMRYLYDAHRDPDPNR